MPATAVPGMLEPFAGKTAVVTGAASGIGAGLAERCAQAGMNVALADVDEPGLDAVARRVAERAAGAPLARRADVADPESVAAFADAVYRRFGAVHLLFNNAGVLLSGLSWERPLADWRWVVDVNLFGVVHGIRAFVPRMLEAGESGRVVNTASMAGLLAGPYLAPYTASKHAIVGLSETMQHEFEALGCMLRASVLCPGEVRTGIMRSERARAGAHGESPGESPGGRSDGERAMREYLERGVDAGMPAEELADYVFERLAAGRFWMLPHPRLLAGFERRAESIRRGEDPAVDIQADR